MALPVRAGVRAFLERHAISDQLLVVGVSGGADSLALLHSLRSLSEDFGLRLHAAHLNHQLRGAESEDDARFVEATAQSWGVPVSVESHDVQAYARAKRLSVEEAARMVRYGFLEQVAEREGALAVAVAHHADDQVETILMHFLRGAGLAGLRGMQPESQYPFQGPRRLLRPLLDVHRLDIETYCADEGIASREDATNADTRFLRNRLRHEVLPLLEQINPNLRHVLRRSARVLSDDYQYLMQRAAGAWQRTLVEQTQDSVSFSLSGWSSLQPSLKRALIRQAVMRLRPALRNLDAQHVEDALRAADHGPVGSRATLPNGLWLFHDFDAIVIGEKLPQPDLPRSLVHPVRLNVPGHTKVGHEWSVEARILPRSHLTPDALRGIDPLEAFFDADKAGDSLRIRGREPNDQFRPLGMAGHGKALRRFMTDAKIPTAWRARTPLVVSGDDILWVAGWQIAEHVKVDQHTVRVLALRFSKESA